MNKFREITTLVKTLTEQVTLSRTNSERNTAREENVPKVATLSTLCDIHIPFILIDVIRLLWAQFQLLRLRSSKFLSEKFVVCSGR